MTRFRGSLFDNKKALKSFDCYLTDTIGDFERELEEAFQDRYDNKDENFLISPSVFTHIDVVKTERGLKNVIFACGIWLDFDGGDLKPFKLSRIFPHLRMTIYSSFNSTKTSLRFRVYIPTDRAMTGQQYKVITGELVKTIIAAGFYEKKAQGQHHGLDMGKLNAASLFYLPCQPKDPSGASFKVFKGNGREPIIVREWIEKYIARGGGPLKERGCQHLHRNAPRRGPALSLRDPLRSCLTQGLGSIRRRWRELAGNGRSVIRAKGTVSFSCSV